VHVVPFLGEVFRWLIVRRRDRAVDQGLARWLDASARGARSGATLRQALVQGCSAIAGEPVHEHLAPMIRGLESGAPVTASLESIAAKPTHARQLVSRALRLAGETGGPVAPMLDAVASTLHDQQAFVREVRALSTQARASATVMVAAPVAFAAVAIAIDSRVAAYVRSAPGLLCAVAGLGLDAAGAAWMARIVGDQR
jgi:Flp pilus assembly protein TadB